MKKKKSPEFSNSWFSTEKQILLKKILVSNVDPNGKFLEIGVFEGQSFIWFMQTIFYGSKSRAIGIEPGFYKLADAKLLKNLKTVGLDKRSTILKSTSELALRNFRSHEFDVIFVDGNHSMKHVLTDAILSWPLLKEGGYLVFDDYDLNQNVFPVDLRPQLAIDTFLTAYRSEVEVVIKDDIVIIRKIRPLPTFLGLTSFALSTRHQLVSDPKRGLTLVYNNQAVPLTEVEKKLWISVFSNLNIGDSRFHISTKSKKYVQLRAFFKKNDIPFQDFKSRNL